MNYATKFAIVKNGTVTNLLTGLVYNTMDDFPNAVHTENLDVQIGDTYENGVFMRDGQVVTGGNVGVQSDWNQNDDTQPDYVKNRPFYAGDPVETVLVEESTTAFSDEGGVYGGGVTSTFSATVGNTYRVYWDGAVYESVCADYRAGLTAIGNLSIAGAGADTGEPFLIVPNGSSIYIYTADTSASHTFSICVFASEVVKIDEKYLPISTDDSYGIVKKSEIVTSYKFSLNAPHDLMVEAITNFRNGRASIMWGSSLLVSAEYDSSTDKITVCFADKPNIVNIYQNDGGFYNFNVGETKYGELKSHQVLLYNESADNDYLALQAVGNIPDMTLEIGAEHISLGNFEIANQKELYLTSSTANSSKRFKITVDDSGAITATEVS